MVRTVPSGVVRRAVVLVLIVGACSGAPAAAPPTPPAPVAAPSTSTTLLDYPDLALRTMWRAMREPRPVERSALPPRHYDEDAHPVTLVDRHEIVPGGPPPDGIPSIDSPSFQPVGDVEGLDADEAVLVLERGDAVRIYPVRIMMWHEIVNDVIGGTPVTVTYCPLCNSAVAFDRTVDGQVLDFGTSGYLYRSGLVMYDRQTESLWTHFDGRAVVGELMGTQLDLVSVATMSWRQAAEAHPQAAVLRVDPHDERPYGRNPYVAYDQADEPLRGWFSVEIPRPIPPMTRVVGIRDGDAQTAVPTEVVAAGGVYHLSFGEVPLVIVWQSGLASPLQRAHVADGDDVGATGVFDRRVDGRVVTLEAVATGFLDAETGSTWDLRGRATAGPMTGARLREVEHLDTFWFAWVGYHPDTRLEGADG